VSGRAFAALVAALVVTTVASYEVRVDERASGWAVVDASGQGLAFFPVAAQPRLQRGLVVRLALPGPSNVVGVITSTQAPVSRPELVSLLGADEERRLGTGQAFSLVHVAFRTGVPQAGSRAPATVRLARVRLLDLLLPSFLYGR
jgi:hypothetical protein